MRLHLRTSASQEKIPFNYQSLLTGALHKWLGENQFHDSISLYSFSWLRDGIFSRSGLRFPNGASYFISSSDSELLKQVIKGIQESPEIAYGLQVKEVVLQEDPEFRDEHRFICASPILIKRREVDRDVHYIFKDEESDAHLTNTLKTKLRKAGMSDEGVSVAFDRLYPGAKTKVIYYNEIGNRANVCPVIIKGSPEQLAFAWNVGVGNSTGIGFGALN